MDPAKRWRRTRVLIYSIMAFSRAREKGVEDQMALTDNLLPPTPETVVPVQPDCLLNLARLKNIGLLHQLGGIEGVASGVGTCVEKGIQGDDEDIACRCLEYGSNTIPKQPPKLIHILFETIRDPIIIVLLSCGALALGFGIKRHGKGGLSNGVSIFIAVFFVISITAFSNLWPKRQLFKSSEARENFNTTVLRNWQQRSISVFEAVVGDVVILKIGDQVPADGLYIDGYSLRVDESNVMADMIPVDVDDSNNPFLLSGTKVIDGSARMLVTAVGKNTEWGKMLSLKSYQSDERTPLQKRLHELSKIIAIIGSTVASMVLVVLLIRYFSGDLHDDDGKSHFVAGKTRCSEVFNDAIGILATPIAIASTAIPEGLLLAVLISIAFSVKRMTTQKAQVRNHSACEVIGTTTVICTDEKCLTSNRLAVAEFYFGDKHITEHPCSVIPQNVFEVISQAVFLTTSEASFLSPNHSSDSQIENAIQEWGVRHLCLDVEQSRANYTICSPETFNSENTRNFTRIKNRNDDSLHAHQKGEAEAILPICSHYYDEQGTIKYMPNCFRENLAQIVQGMISKGLIRCIAFAHKYNSQESDDERLIFIGFVGLKYPCPPEVCEAVKDCKNAGVDIKLVTRNDLPSARAIAIECGILDSNCDMTTGEVVDGLEFQSYADNEKLEKCPRICVMARASTMQKVRMVQCLKEKGEVVAVTGYTMGDAIALREADVGLSLETQGTQQVKSNSDVILIGDSFDSVARVLTWGRAMYLKIQLFAQFQLIVSVSSLVIDSVIAISAGEPATFKIVTAISSGKVLYATIQVLWVKLIVGALAAIAITAEKPPELGQLPKVIRDRPFITHTMRKNIVGQAIYPIIILLTIQFQGKSIFNLDSRTKDTMNFNIFVLWQICVILNTKGIERNIFEGMWRRKLLWGIIGLIIFIQVLIVEPLHTFADTKPLTLKQWMICIGIAFLAWPIGWLIEKVKCSTEAFLQHLE